MLTLKQFSSQATILFIFLSAAVIHLTGHVPLVVKDVGHCLSVSFLYANNIYNMSEISIEPNFQTGESNFQPV